MATSITQEALQIPGGFGWTEGDPVSLIFLVDTDWSGTYLDADIRQAHNSTSTLVGVLTVTAEYDTVAYPDETIFTLSMTEAQSQMIPAGKYYTDIQLAGGVTRCWACIAVAKQVTVV